MTQMTKTPSFVFTMSLLATAVLAGCAGDKSNMPKMQQQMQLQPIQSSLPTRDFPGQTVIDPAEVARVNVQLATSYYSYGQFDAALEAVHRALAAQPNNAQALVLGGFSFLEIKDMPRAEESFSRAMAAAPRDPDVLHNQATFLCRTNREAQSIAVFDRAIAIQTYRRPGLSEAGAGVCLMKLNRTDEAYTRFQNALSSEPFHPQALLGMAELEFKRGDTAKAQAYLRRQQQVASPSPESMWLDVQIARARGNRDDANMAAADLRSKFPGSEQAKMLDSTRP